MTSRIGQTKLVLGQTHTMRPSLSNMVYVHVPTQVGNGARFAVCRSSAELSISSV